MIGFDKESGAHIRIMERIAKRDNVQYQDICLKDETLKAYELYRSDLKEFPYERWQYDCIICNNVLHFLPDTERLELIKRLYSQLLPGGILTLRINHSQNKGVKEKSIEREKNVWVGKIFKNEVMYLVDIVDFEVKLRHYPQLQQYYEINDNAVAVIIKKP